MTTCAKHYEYFILNISPPRKQYTDYNDNYYINKDVMS